MAALARRVCRRKTSPVKRRPVLPPGTAALRPTLPAYAHALAVTLPVVPALPLRVPDGDAATAPGSGAVDLSGGTVLPRKSGMSLTPTPRAERGVIVAGDPDSCIKAAKFHEATGDDRLQFLMATATVAHDKATESIALFGRQVIPAFR